MKTLIWRVFDPTDKGYSQDILDSASLSWLESEINYSKKIRAAGQWEACIKAPFDYSLPVPVEYATRFQPPGFQRNAFYSSYLPRTSVFETVFHFMSFRRASSGTFSSHDSEKCLFSVNWEDKSAVDLSEDPEVQSIMDKSDYEAAHNWIRANSSVSSIIYPSCRDPENNKNVSTLKIETLGHYTETKERLYYSYHVDHTIIKASGKFELPGKVEWLEVS